MAKHTIVEWEDGSVTIVDDACQNVAHDWFSSYKEAEKYALDNGLDLN